MGVLGLRDFCYSRIEGRHRKYPPRLRSGTVCTMYAYIVNIEFGKICMTWVPDISDADGPIYLALAQTIARAVASGDLPEGSQLPSHRELAKTLGVDVTTVTRAYAEVKRAGIIDSDRGRGSFVRRRRQVRPSPFQ